MTFVSIRHRIAFVHVPRTGGSSIANVLRGVGDEVGLAPHLRARDIAAQIGFETWSTLRSFAVVREPVDWLRSTWRFIRQQPLHPLFVQATVMDWPEFARSVSFLSPLGWRQCDFLADAAGRPLCRFVLRFERLAQDWAELAPQLGLPPELPHTNASRPDSEEDDPDGSGRATIETVFAEDAMRLGYPIDPAVRDVIEDRWAQLGELVAPGWPADPFRLRAIGELLFASHEFDGALYVFQRASKLAPEAQDAARFARMPRRFGEATPSFEDVIAAVERAASGVGRTALVSGDALPA